MTAAASPRFVADLRGEPTREALSLLVQAFYDDVRAHPGLGPVFAAVIGDHWSVHLERMVEFWCTVMLGTHSFKGNVFGKHMQIDGVKPAHFLSWLSLWRRHTALRFEGDARDRLQQTAAGIARNLYYGYFGVFPRFRYEGTAAVEVLLD